MYYSSCHLSLEVRLSFSVKVELDGFYLVWEESEGWRVTMNTGSPEEGRKVQSHVQSGYLRSIVVTMKGPGVVGIC